MRGAIVLALVLVCAWLVWSSRGDEVAPFAPLAAAQQPRAEAAQPATSDAPRRADDADGEPEPEREAAPLPPRPRSEPPASASKTLFSQRVCGRVLHADGRPAAGAGVRGGSQSKTTDDDGRFALDVNSPGDDLAAWLAGEEPASVPDVAQHPDVVAGRVLDVVLPGPALTIDGFLFAPDGKPAKGWHVHLHGGGIPVDDSGLPVLSAEDLAAGASLRSVPQTRWRGSNPNEREIGDDGPFVFGGLRRDHDYVLRAWNQKTLQTALSPPLRAGTRGYAFVVPPGSFRELVRGRATDRHGGPVGGARVRLTMRVHKNGTGESYETGQTTQTDDDGRFQFAQVIREDLLLRFDGEQVVPLYHEFPANYPGDDVLVRVGTLCRFRFEPSPAAPLPTSLRALDAQQQPLRLTRKHPTEEGRTDSYTRLPWNPGDDAREITVGDEATWLEIERTDRAVLRVPLHQQRGDVTVVRG